MNKAGVTNSVDAVKRSAANKSPSTPPAVFILEKTINNGEYGERVHFSAHASFKLASKHMGRLLTVNEIKAKDAPNRWEKDFTVQPVWKYRTGYCGHVDYTIIGLLVD
jgi:hypothetical protein